MIFRLLVNIINVYIICIVIRSGIDNVVELVDRDFVEVISGDVVSGRRGLLVDGSVGCGVGVGNGGVGCVLVVWIRNVGVVWYLLWNVVSVVRCRVHGGMWEVWLELVVVMVRHVGLVILWRMLLDRSVVGLRCLMLDLCPIVVGLWWWSNVELLFQRCIRSASTSRLGNDAFEGSTCDSAPWMDIVMVYV